jgi:hypothetical protein
VETNLQTLALCALQACVVVPQFALPMWLWLCLVLVGLTSTAPALDCSDFFLVPGQDSPYAYFVEASPATFNESLCQDIFPHARLAVIRNQASRKYIWNQVMKVTSAAWIGLFQTMPDVSDPLANWIWVDNVTCANSPDDERCYFAISLFNPGQDCACMSNYFPSSSTTLSARQT